MRIRAGPVAGRRDEWAWGRGEHSVASAAAGPGSVRAPTHGANYRGRCLLLRHKDLVLGDSSWDTGLKQDLLKLY